MTVTFYDKKRLRRLHITGVAKLTSAPVVDGRPGGYRGMVYMCADATGQYATFTQDRYIMEKVEE